VSAAPESSTSTAARTSEAAQAAPGGPPHPPRRRLGLGRIVVIVLVAGFLALLTYGLMAEADNDAIDQSLASGRAAPAPALDLPWIGSFALGPGISDAVAERFDDRRVSLAELRGTPVVLNFWASWCPPCRTEQPILERAWIEQEPRGKALFLGVNMQDLTGDAEAYLREFGVGYPNVRDPSDATSRRFGATGLPETFFIDREGRVVGHVIGAVSEAQLAAGVEAAKSGRVLGARPGGDRREVR
jgi:cytochrome c biogenesis protein CcmG/thiol:disulfide interchange protein DsbE